MKTSLDLNTEIYKLLVASGIKTSISGGIYRGERPADSVIEDIVINTISLGDGTRQHGSSNVNIHVADIAVNIAGKQHYAANTVRLQAITNALLPYLEEHDGENYVLWVENTQEVDVPEVNQHFMNIRLKVQMYNHT